MFNLTQYTLLLHAVNSARTARAKGATFEELIAYLFEKMDGVKLDGHDVQLPAEEIDLIFWNAKTDTVLTNWDGMFLVECKNWSTAVGAPELDNFISKLRRRGLKNGVFVAAQGVTGQYSSNRAKGAKGNILSALQEGIRVITITKSDLDAITSIDQFRELVRKRFSGIFVGNLLN